MEAMAADEHNEGNSSAQRREVMTLGSGPFQRDPASAAAALGKSSAESTKKPRPQVLLVLSKGMTSVKTEAIDSQSCSSDGDAAALEEEKDTSSSAVVGMKRKAKALDTSSNKKKASTANKSSQQKWQCSLCGISATSEQGLSDHLQGKKHKNKEASSKFNDPSQKISSEHNSNRLYCSLCNKFIPSEKRLKVHLEGRKHKAKEARVGEPSQVDVPTEAMHIDSASVGSKEILKCWHCQVCNETLDEAGIAAHRKSSQHISLAQKSGGVIVASRTGEAAKGALYEIAKYISYAEEDDDGE